MKNILLISREFPPSLGGTGIAMYNYIKNMESYDFTTLTFFEQKFDNAHIIIKKLPNPFGFGHRYLSAFSFVFSTLLNPWKDFDGIIGNAFIGASCGAIIKKLRNKPLISIVHDIDYLYDSQCHYNIVNKFIRKRLFDLIFSASDVIVVPNPLIKKDIRKILGKDAAKKVAALTLGVDLERFQKIRKPKGKRIILFVGAVRRNKGLSYLIQAFKQVSNRFGDTELWIAGSFVERDHYAELKNLVKELKIERKVKFLGPVKHFGKKNVFSLYDASDIVVIPSYFGERFGIPCVEASLMSKPLVATDVFEENGTVVGGKTALVVPKKDAEALARAIITFLENRKLRKKLGKQAREYARRFETTNLSKKFEEIVKNTI